MTHRTATLVLLTTIFACSQSAPMSQPPPSQPPSSQPPSSQPPSSQPPSSRSGVAGNDELVFVGTVTSIRSAAGADSRRDWVVTMHVDEVLSGSFAGEQFSFAIHSPTKSGLAEGGKVTVRATAVPGGWQVDEHQWTR